ncbi:hypothetical protein KNP414_02200 [Paenibacillus mucilaginosus KNP414]|uniref:Uncharacterized protein n=1 Tax=Paenibacillus mucilaginosus (strain KNP414) TaxID=1036673 RepID=F8F531_PAEMK|nr:hypothetical protein KNP414_02200 [Paenibacillus mucilaginosus KNP414]
MRQIFNPASKYSCPIVKAYDASGSDVKTFALNPTGAVGSPPLGGVSFYFRKNLMKVHSHR